MNTIERLLTSLSTDAPVRQVLMGAFWTAVVVDGDPPRCGLASTLRPSIHTDEPPIPPAGDLLSYSGQQVAQWLRSSSVLQASIGMAAFNALLPVDPAACSEVNAEEVIVQRGTGRRVAIIGHFPFVERVRQAAAECWVIELYPRPGDLPAEQAVQFLPQADVVALSGTTLINHTIDDLLPLCRPDAFVVLLGPSTPLTPLFFDLHIDAISGTLVTDPERVLRSVSQGATFRQIKRAGGLRLLTLIRDESPIK